jgi:hypothetical protein
VAAVEEANNFLAQKIKLQKKMVTTEQSRSSDSSGTPTLRNKNDYLKKGFAGTKIDL